MSAASAAGSTSVNLACIIGPDYPFEACLGDWVLVHVGFAMSWVEEEEAKKTLEFLTELGEKQAEISAMMEEDPATAE
jgi:hydrogenase expression/formation protein HypC